MVISSVFSSYSKAKTMFKRVILGLIVALAVAVGLYQLRIQILTTAFNSALAQADVRLLQLDGLKVGWGGVDIAQLVLGVGKHNVPQRLDGVHLAYNILNLQLQSLAVRRAALTSPGSSEDQVGDGSIQLSKILDQLITAPLQSITVDALEVGGFSSPMLRFPIALQAGWGHDSFVFEVTDQNMKLLIELKQLAANKRTLTLNLAISDRPAIGFEATLARRGGRQQVEGAGQLWVDAAMPLLASGLEIPELLTDAAGVLQFQLSGQWEDELQGGQQQVWQLQILPQSILEVELADNNAAINMQVNFPRPLTASLQPAGAQGMVLSLSGEKVGWQLFEQVNQVTAAGMLTGIECQYRAAAACNALLDIELRSPQITIPSEQTLLIENSSLQLSAQLQLSGNAVTANVAPGKWLHADALARGDIFAVEPALVAERAGKLEYQLSPGELSFQVDDLNLMLPQLQMPQVNVATLLNLQGLELTRSEDGQLNARVQLEADAINIQSPDTWLPALAVSSEVIMTGHRVSLQGQVQGGGQLPLFEVSAEFQMDTGEGAARVLTQELSFDADGNRLSQHFDYWPFEWDIFAGNLILDIDLKWQQDAFDTELQATIKQRMKNIAGVYREVGFVGLDSKFDAFYRSPEQFVTTSVATFSLDLLDVGVPIEDIEARFLLDLSQQKLTLKMAKAHLFGGRVWIDDAIYFAEKAHNPIFIGVDGMQLDQLLELAGYDAVKGTGTISGLLPLDVNKAGITMERGMLAAKAPGGVFSYTTEVAAGTNIAMVQVIDALKNYHYSVFQLEADYLDNGDLELAMVLRGNNPDLQQGRPIHLNLNVTDNIPTLLKSLQSGRVIADAVSKKLGGGMQ